jgi:tRNA A37 methylthiotransferase MiaB
VTKVFIENLNPNCEPATDLLSKAIRFLESNDYEIVDSADDADITLINTCCVLKIDENRARRAVKKSSEKSNIEKTIFFGCAAGTVKDFRNTENVEHVGPKDLKKMNDILKHKIPIDEDGVNPFVDGQYLERTSEKLVGTDLYIHISQGCTHACTFCNIKTAKGGVTSKSIESIRDNIIEYLQRVRKDSYEFVLQSDDCGGYGTDIKEDIVTLMEELSKINKNIKYKISNIHPEDLIRLWPRLKKYIKMFSYMNIPLETGSQRILALMDRYYEIDDVEKIINEMRELSPDTWIYSDFIINFPTETLDDLKATLACGRKMYDEKRYISYSEFPNKKSAKIFPKIEGDEVQNRIRYVRDYIYKTQDNATICGAYSDVETLHCYWDSKTMEDMSAAALKDEKDENKLRIKKNLMDALIKQFNEKPFER